jgi:hypothetical protein
VGVTHVLAETGRGTGVLCTQTVGRREGRSRLFVFAAPEKGKIPEVLDLFVFLDLAFLVPQDAPCSCLGRSLIVVVSKKEEAVGTVVLVIGTTTVPTGTDLGRYRSVLGSTLWVPCISGPKG